MAGYIRQNSYIDGNVVNAADSNEEFDQLVAVFDDETGHAHDGTAANGPVLGLIGDSGLVTPLNKVVVSTANDRISFFSKVSTSSIEQVRVEDGVIYAVTNNDVDLGTLSLKFRSGYFDGVLYTDNLAEATAAAGVTIDGVLLKDSTVTATTFIGNLTGDVTGDLTGDVTGDITGNLTGDITGNITGDVTGNVTGNLIGDVTGDVTGDLTGDVTGNVSGTAATVTGAAQVAITSLGTISYLEVGSSTAPATSLTVRSPANRTGLNLISEATNSKLAEIGSYATDTFTRDLVTLLNNSSAATGSTLLKIRQNAAQDAVNIVAVSGNNAINITSGDLTVADVVYADNLAEATSNAGVTIDSVLLKDNVVTATTFVGELTGDVTGDVTGNVTGNLTGDITGDITGNITGNLTGNVTGNTTGTSATVTGAAQTAITSVGTLTALTVDNINIDGAVITSDTGAISFGDENITTTGTLNTGAIDAAGLELASGAAVTEFSIDGTLAGNSDAAVPTEKAAKTYIDTVVGDINTILTAING